MMNTAEKTERLMQLVGWKTVPDARSGIGYYLVNSEGERQSPTTPLPLPMKNYTNLVNFYRNVTKASDALTVVKTWNDTKEFFYDDTARIWQVSDNTNINLATHTFGEVVDLELGVPYTPTTVKRVLDLILHLATISKRM